MKDRETWGMKMDKMRKAEAKHNAVKRREKNEFIRKVQS